MGGVEINGGSVSFRRCRLNARKCSHSEHHPVSERFVKYNSTGRHSLSLLAAPSRPSTAQRSHQVLVLPGVCSPRYQPSARKPAITPHTTSKRPLSRSILLRTWQHISFAQLVFHARKTSASILSNQVPDELQSQRARSATKAQHTALTDSRRICCPAQAAARPMVPRMFVRSFLCDRLSLAG